MSAEPVVLTRHPRAVLHLRLAKGWGGLVCFVLAVLLSRRAAVPLPESLGRGIVAGLAGMVACWAATLAVWRQLALAELHAARRRILEARGEAAGDAVAEPAA